MGVNSVVVRCGSRGFLLHCGIAVTVWIARVCCFDFVMVVVLV